MFFSLNVSSAQIDAIKEIFNLNVVLIHEKCLGLPSMVGRNKNFFFNDLKLKITNKIKGWQNTFFSCAGKEVITKVVAQAIPSYAISVFKIPFDLCIEMQRLLKIFRWRKKKNKK